MRKSLCVAATCCLAGFAFGDVIWDNGPADGDCASISCGNFTFGYREVTDDFVLDPAYPQYNIEDMEWSYIWHSGASGPLNVSVQISFYEDDGTTKPVMDPFYRTTVPATGVLTGNYMYGRPEIWYSCQFDCVIVDSDTPYWASAVIMDPPENGFWMGSKEGIDNIFRGEVYIDMADVGYPRWTSCYVAFGDYHDMAFQLTGYGIPEPGTLGLLALGGLALIRRR